MHNTFAILHRWLQGISHEAFVRSLRKTGFINWQSVSYLTVYKFSTYKQGTHPLRRAESFCVLSSLCHHCASQT